MRRSLWIFLCIGANISALRNPFRYETTHDQNDTIQEPCCVGEGTCGDERLQLIRVCDGELHLIKEKVPSTLGKAEGLGG